jgi:hypothetical protein
MAAKTDCDRSGLGLRISPFRLVATTIAFIGGVAAGLRGI